MFALGHKRRIATPRTHIRLTLESGYSAAKSACPLCHKQISRRSFDHRVNDAPSSAGSQRPWLPPSEQNACSEETLPHYRERVRFAEPSSANLGRTRCATANKKAVLRPNSSMPFSASNAPISRQWISKLLFS